MVSSDGVIKLIDFGCASQLRKTVNSIKSQKGTSNWMAPEIIKLDHISVKADIWSFGCTLFEMVCVTSIFYFLKSYYKNITFKFINR